MVCRPGPLQGKGFFALFFLTCLGSLQPLSALPLSIDECHLESLAQERNVCICIGWLKAMSVGRAC